MLIFPSVVVRILSADFVYTGGHERHVYSSHVANFQIYEWTRHRSRNGISVLSSLGELQGIYREWEQHSDRSSRNLSKAARTDLFFERRQRLSRGGSELSRPSRFLRPVG